MSHKASSISLKKQLISADSNTTFLAHYDITANEVLKGISPIQNVATLRDGYYGGGIAVEEGTTNLWSGELMTYSNYTQSEMPSSTIPTGETYLGDTIYRSTFTPISANALSSIQNDPWSHGVLGSTITYASGNSHTASIYWRPLNKVDIQVGGVASNVAGWSDVGTFPTNDGWNRSISKWYDTTSRTDAKFWSFWSPSAKAGEPIVIDWVAPQIEMKAIETSFTKGVRGGGILDYGEISQYIPKDQYTITMWVNGSNGSYGTSQDWNMCFSVSPAFYFGWDARNALVVSVCDSTRAQRTVRYTGQTFNSNQWYMVGYTFKDGLIKVYVDGKKVSEDTITPTISYNRSDSETKNLYIGNYYGSTIFHMNGIMDEVRIDRIERTEEEIESWYISQLPFYPKGIYRLAY